MLRVMADVLSAADGRQVTLLSQLDMSPAFSCVDLDLFLQWLEKHCGLKGNVLRWMISFLTDRTQQVTYNSMSSVVMAVTAYCKDPLLCILYMDDLSTAVASHGLTLHQYANDCQLYLSFPVADGQSAAD